MRRLRFITASSIIAFISLVGCIPGHIPYTTLPDTSAVHLSLLFLVRIDDMTSWTANVSFTTNHTRVKFTRGEQVICDGVTLSYSSTDDTFSQSLPLKSHGADYACHYISGKETTTWQFVLPDPIHVLEPQPNATLDPKQMTIRYTAPSGGELEVSADTGEKTPSLSVNEPTRNEPGFYQFSMSPPVPVGTGRLIIHFVHHETLPGTGFAEAAITSVNNVVIPIIWS
jgi:hypothetical protein